MYLLVIYLPLISAFVAGFCGRWLGKKGASWFTTILLGITFLLSCFIFYEVCLYRVPCYINIFPWIQIDNLIVNWGFLFDNLTASMLIVVNSISFLVHLYSIDYMSEDPHRSRFMSYLSLFTFFMIMLVTSNNLIQLFFGWEGVGLASYLLINFWFTRLQANKSAMKAMIVNKVGDFALGIALLSIFYCFGSFDYLQIFELLDNIKYNYFVIFDYKIHTLTFISCFPKTFWY